MYQERKADKRAKAKMRSGECKKCQLEAREWLKRWPSKCRKCEPKK